MTKQGNTFNGASQLVQLNGSSQYPAKDGSLITNLTGVLSGGSANTIAYWTGSTALGNSNLIYNGTVSNVELFLSSQTFSAASSFSFGLVAPASSTIYCVLTATQTQPSGTPSLRFNGDSGSNYLYGTVTSAAGSTVLDNNNGASLINLNDGSRTFQRKFRVSFNFITGSAGASDTEIGGQSSGYCGGANGLCLATWAGQWTGGAAPSYGTITDGAGTMTGFIRCTYSAY